MELINFVARSAGLVIERRQAEEALRIANERQIAKVEADLAASRDLVRELELSRVELKQAKDRFQTIVETIDAAFAIVQVEYDQNDKPINYRFVEINPAFERQAGVDLRGKRVTEFAPHLEQFWFDTYGHVASTGEPANFESYAEAFKRWFDVRAVRVGDPKDRQIAILFNDVTARREAQDRLRVSEANARENAERVQLALAAGAIIGTWHWDLPSDQFTVDEGFANAFGLDPALGRKGIPLAQIVKTVHPDDQAGLAEAIRDVVKRGGPYAYQYRVRRANGRYYWIEANGHVDHGPDGTPLSFPGVVIDVEERRSIEAERDRAIAALRTLNDSLEQRVAERTAELMRAEEALRQAQKMEAVGQLTGGIAHDFNNMLTGVIGGLNLVQRHIALGRMDRVDRYIEMANTSAQRAAALTSRLLAFGRRQSLDLKSTDVNMLVAGMEDLLYRTLGEQVALEVHLDPGLWSAYTDGNQLESALLNLSINARDAMPAGGKLIIETSNTQLDQRYVRDYADLQPGDYVVLSVTDTGTGMSASTVEKAFEPFFTTKPLGQGTGLGLSMIYGFARQSGGHVRIYSELGTGTTVKLFLPRRNGMLDVAEIPDGEVTPLGAGEMVMVVEDDASVRMIVTEVLDELGYGVIEAVDALAAIPILESNKRIDLLVTDVGLPGMNGRQLAEIARQSRPGLKILFITGYAENAAVRAGFLDSGMEMMTKPFAIEALAAKLRDMLGAQAISQ
ncbi:two-component system sensor histidine kinase/response regulator [Bordetella sp. N]|nr:two-component system sensor histidine kinase/response regulator [Bordetella sp. N]